MIGLVIIVAGNSRETLRPSPPLIKIPDTETTALADKGETDTIFTNATGTKDFFRKKFEESGGLATVSSNLTENVGRRILGEIVSKNPDGPSLIQGSLYLSVLQPVDMTQKAVADELQNSDPNMFKVAIKISDVKVSTDETKSFLNNYLKEVELLMEKNVYKADYADSLGGLNTMKDTLTSSISQLTKLRPPKIMAIWHTELLSILSTRRQIYEAIAQTESDPIKALLAVKALKINNQDLVKFGLATQPKEQP